MFIVYHMFPIFVHIFPYLSISFPRFSTSTNATAHFRLGWGPSPQLFKVAQLAPWALVAVPMDSSSLGVWISLKFWWWYNMMIYVCWVLKYQKNNKANSGPKFLELLKLWVVFSEIWICGFLCFFMVPVFFSLRKYFDFGTNVLGLKQIVGPDEYLLKWLRSDSRWKWIGVEVGSGVAWLYYI